MRRDMAVCMEILDEVAGYPGYPDPGMLFPDGDRDEVGYLVRLLEEAGYLKDWWDQEEGRRCVRLTWEGNDLLEELEAIMAVCDGASADEARAIMSAPWQTVRELARAYAYDAARFVIERHGAE